MSDEICNKKLYDQDDGEKFHCQLPKMHKGDCTPWPELRIDPPEHFSFPEPSEATQ